MTIQRLRLPNGMTLLLEEAHEAPVVALQTWVSVGSADEVDEIAGIAHLHEHMLFKGTARRGVGEIARAVEAAGGEINAWTSYDETVYHLVLAASELSLGLDVLADAVRNSSFDPEELAREIEVVIEEIHRADDVPARRVANAIFSLAYERHPYRRPVLGSEASVRSLSRERILGFFRGHYRPERTTLVAVGDFATDELVRRVEASFGDWERVTPASAAGPSSAAAVSAAARLDGRPVEPVQRVLRSRMLREDVKEARFSLAWHIPGLRHADTAAVDALSVLLGHGESSRLFVETRRRRELVNDVHAYAYTPRDPGLLMVGASLRAERMRAALESVLDETYRMRESLVPADELAKATVVILSESAYQRETVQGEARRLGFYEVVGGDYAFEDEYRQALAALTPERIRDVARQYLTDTPSLVVQVPSSAGEPVVSTAEGSALSTVEGAAAAAPAEPLAMADLTALVDRCFAKSAARRRRPAAQRGVTERVQLDNGATILVQETDAPVVSMRAVALGGLRWEKPDTAGLGTLFSAIDGLATEELGPEALARRVALLGGSLTAFSGRNTLGLRAEFIREKSVEGLYLFCDALLRPAFDAANLERERAVLIERVKSREDNPVGVAFDLFAEALYPTHPYGLRIIGTEETLPRFTLEDILAHESAFLCPDKLVVAVVGGFAASQALELLGRELGERKSAPLPQPPPPNPPPSESRHLRKALAKKQAHIVVGGMGTTVFDDDRFSLEVLTTILSGQSGRLFLDLRDKQSLAYSVSSNNLEGLDPGHVLVHIGTSPDKVPQALGGLYSHLARLRDEPVTAEELERAQRYLIGVHAIELQRSGARAMSQALGERFGQGYDDYKHYPERIRGVTTARVQAVAQRYLDPKRLVEVVVGPD